MASLRSTSSRAIVPGAKTKSQPYNPFDALPIEVTQHIAELLDSDTSFCAFQASCVSARNAINGDNFSLWRRRFVSRFEPTGWPQKENVRYKKAYHHRRRVLKNGATFKEGRTGEERECLDLLRELIVGSFADTSSTKLNARGIRNSGNLTSLIDFLRSTNLLTTIFRPQPATTRYGTPRPASRPDPLLPTIRVVCAPLLLSLEPHLINEQFSFPDSQAAVYSSVAANAFFGGRCGLDVNMEFVLHNINFWRYHMVRSAEHTLFTAFSDLREAERPQWWRGKLEQGTQTLGRWWKGSYAYLDEREIRVLRDPGRADDHDHDLGAVPIQDIFAGEDDAFSFQDMQLHVVADGKMKWPAAFERHLNALTPPPPSSPPGVHTRAQKRSGVGGTPEEIAAFKPLSFRFDGSGSDAQESFLATGWLNPLPPQQGIPGWKRLTMMKYFDSEEGGPGVYGANVDWDALWAYEGLVLPGGRIVVGRWWSPHSGTGVDQYSGPFILWCVDRADGYGAELECGETESGVKRV